MILVSEIVTDLKKGLENWKMKNINIKVINFFQQKSPTRIITNPAKSYASGGCHKILKGISQQAREKAGRTVFCEAKGKKRKADMPR